MYIISVSGSCSGGQSEAVSVRLIAARRSLQTAGMEDGSGQMTAETFGSTQMTTKGKNPIAMDESENLESSSVQIVRYYCLINCYVKIIVF